MNYNTNIFIRRTKPIRIIGDPHNQRPDKWSSTVLHTVKEEQTFIYRPTLVDFQLDEQNSYLIIYNTFINVLYINKFLRHLLGITKLDKEKNQCIREKTGAENIVKEIKQYQEKWLQHIQKMDTNRIPKQTLQYKPKGRRHIGRPRKRWRDQFHFEDKRNRNQT